MHALTAKRHHAHYRLLDYKVHCFRIAKGCPQRRLFTKRMQGYCTATSYDGLTGRDVSVVDDGVTVDTANLRTFFTEEEFKRFGV